APRRPVARRDEFAQGAKLRADAFRALDAHRAPAHGALERCGHAVQAGRVRPERAEARDEAREVDLCGETTGEPPAGEHLVQAIEREIGRASRREREWTRARPRA